MNGSPLRLEDRRRARLASWLRARPEAPAGEAGHGRRRVWLVETVVLVLVGLLFAAATVNDLSREAGTNHRLIADLATWRHYTHHDYVNISIDQETLGVDSGRELLCGNTSPGPPGARTQICLAIWGPVAGGLRTVQGGWYLPPYHPDLTANRYGCFGTAGRGRCPR
ncbi:MAG: hypothetical protein ACRDJX_10470 [Solirubrobacteraceae bacterium]